MAMDKETKAIIAALQKWAMAGDVALRIVEAAYGDLGLENKPSFFHLEKEAHENFLGAMRDFQAKHGPLVVEFSSTLELSEQQLIRLAEGLGRPYKNAGKEAEVKIHEDKTPTAPGNDERH